jgi:hypothetical protein
MSDVEKRINIIEGKIAELEKQKGKVEDHDVRIKNLEEKIVKINEHDMKIEKMKRWFRKLKILTNNYVITNVQGRKTVRIKPDVIILNPEDVEIIEREEIGEE